MRFSSIFQLPITPREPAAVPARVEEPAAPFTPAAAALPAEVPDDLDQRVRLVGEWQVSEY